MKKTDLIGVWKLVVFKIFWVDSDKVMYPYGEDAIGYLIYTPEDYVSVHIMRAHRSSCASDDYRNMSVQEMIEIASHSGGYVGRYEVLDQTVIHYPDISNFPNFLNQPQVRKYRFSGKKLTLECDYPGEIQCKQGCSQLVWERV